MTKKFCSKIVDFIILSPRWVTSAIPTNVPLCTTPSHHDNITLVRNRRVQVKMEHQELGPSGSSAQKSDTIRFHFGSHIPQGQQRSTYRERGRGREVQTRGFDLGQGQISQHQAQRSTLTSPSSAHFQQQFNDNRQVRAVILRNTILPVANPRCFRGGYRHQNSNIYPPPPSSATATQGNNLDAYHRQENVPPLNSQQHHHDQFFQGGSSYGYYGHQYQQYQHYGYYQNQHSGYNPFHPQQHLQPHQIPFSNTSGVFDDCVNRANSVNFRRPCRNLSTDVFQRKWEKVGKMEKSDASSSDVPFSVMCYNVLAPTLQKDHNYLYKECDPNAVEWSYRKRVFKKEIELYRPDIVCLQEVEEGYLEEYNTLFRPQGYSGLFKKRTGDKCDGCAIYYQDTKFNLIDSISVEYLQNSVPLLDRDNVALLVKLETKCDNRHRLVVATTHLLFNPRRSDVKIGQAMLLLAELDRLSFCGIDEAGSALYYPTIVTGDFNVDPSHTITQLFSNGSIFVGKDFLCEQEQSRQGNKAKRNIPSQLGISDRCQHYKLKYQRLQQLETETRLNFELSTSETAAFVNLNASTHRIFGEDKNLSEFVAGTNCHHFALGRRIFDSDNKSAVSLQDHNVSTWLGMDKSGNNDDDSLRIEKFGNVEMSHVFNFKDVYGFATELGNNTENEQENFVTTKQKNWVRVDYIYYSTKPNNANGTEEEGGLKLLRRLKLPTRIECNQMGKIPRAGVSSDHFPLLAEFLLNNFHINPEYE